MSALARDLVRLDDLRRHVVAAQAFAARHRVATPADVRASVRHLGAVQLDSISTVERSHRIVLATRVGRYDERAVSDHLRRGRLFENWSHEACILPVEDWPLWRHRMEERRVHHWFGPVLDRDPALAERILAEIRERGPLGSRDFAGRNGGMWDWKPEKRMLDALWTAGQLVVAGRESFQRLYDLPERVIPAKWLDAPPLPREEAWRRLILRAVRARGALTERAIVEHHRFDGGARGIRPLVDALVAEGELRRVEVDDEGATVLLPGDADPAEASGSRAAVLLSPFENMLWDRALTERLFRFRHLIEVYKKPHQRAYGYYVLPLLWGDKLVGRADLKADREAGLLRVLHFHREPGARKREALDDALASALARLAKGLGLAAEA